MFQTVLTIAVLGFVGYRLVGAAGHSLTTAGRQTIAPVVRGVRWRHIWPVPFVLTAVVLAASLLVMVPGLSWGWWTALGGQGNPVTGTTDQTVGTPLEWLIPLCFLLLLFPAIPLFALTEERIFRRGSEHWSARRRVAKTVQFGLVHALIGIPVGVALALAVGGGYFMACYLRGYRQHGSRAEAVLESTRAHAVYNAAIVLMVLVAVALFAAGAAT
jgi:hypothetical protein